MGRLGKLWVSLGLDSSGFKKGINDADKATTSFKDRLKTLGQAVGVAFGIGAIVQFGRKVIQTRGEFESLEISFRTLLKSKSAADALMAQMVDLAARTPFSLQEVATGAKQLLAYGFAASEVRGTLSRLGDVAAGLGLPMERLTYLYGTTRTQGRLFARDLMQFTTSGVPLLDELAKMFGKSTEEINKMVSAGDIGFEEVKQAFGNMTGEAGKFYNLMEERSKGISGKISNLGDAISVMFNKIGQSQEGAINSALDGAKFLVDNYQSVLDILKALIATYGVYKATSIVSNSIHKISDRVTYEAEMSALQKLIPVKRASKNADIEEAVAKGRLSQSSAERIITIRAEAAAELDRLKVIEKSLVSKVAVAAGENAIALQQALNAERRERAAREELSQAMLSGNAQKIRRAEIKLTLVEEELNIALKNKEVVANALATTSTKAKSAATAVDTAQTKINTAATNTGSTAKNLMAAATIRLTKVFHSLRLAFVSNPFGIILTGITLAISAFSIFSNSANNASQELTGLKKATKDAGEEFDKESAKIQALQDIMTNSKVAYDERKRALNELKALIPQYNGELTKEGQIINSNTAAIKDYLVQLEKQIKLKAAQEELEAAYRNKRLKEKELKTNQKSLDSANKNVAQATSGGGTGDAAIEYTRHTLRAAASAQSELNKTQSELQEISKDIKELNSEIEETSTNAGKAAGSFRALAKVIEEIKINKKQIAAIDTKKIDSDQEMAAYQALKAEEVKLDAEYKTFTGKEFGAKVKVETDKDQLKNAASGTIAFLEEEISKRQLAIKLTTNNADIKEWQKEIAGFEATIKAKLEVETPKSERQTIEDEIKGFRDEQLAIPLSIDTVEAQKQFDVLQKKIDERQEKLDKAPKDYAIGSETDLSNKIADQEKLLKTLNLTAEQYAGIKANIDKLKISMDALPQNAFPVGSLAEYDKKIADIESGMNLLTGSTLEAAQASVELLKLQKEIATNGAKPEARGKLGENIKAARENIAKLRVELASASNAGRDTIGAAIEAGERQIALWGDMESAAETLAEAIGSTVTTAIAELASVLGDSGGWNIGGFTARLLDPLGDAAIQAGLLTMGIGTALEALKTAFSNLFGGGPAGAIASGAALLALGVAAKAGAAAITKGQRNASGGANPNTFTGGYSNSGSSTRTAQSLQLVSPQSQTIVVKGEVSGDKLRFVLDKDAMRRKS